MTKKLVVAVALALSLDILATAYGAAAGQDARATCAHDHGAVQDGQCVRNGGTLFPVPV